MPIVAKKLIIILSALLLALLLVFTFSRIVERKKLTNTEAVTTKSKEVPSGNLFKNLIEDKNSKVEKEVNTEDKIVENTKNDETKLKALQSRKVLPNITHVFQTFNNCGPASLSMALSYYGVYESQQTIGLELRPYQNPQGDNDDKSTTLDELADKSEDYGFTALHRPAGDINMLLNFVNNDMPVITPTWTKVNEDIGHYRVVKGYDLTSNEIIQDDSLQGKNLSYSFNEYSELWSKFNYEYLVLVPRDKLAIAKQIVGENYDEEIAWENSKKISEADLQKNPNNVYARFNLLVALYNLGDYQQAIAEYEKIEDKLPSRTLWYQIEPILSYFEVGNYSKVFEISDYLFTHGNKAYSELYILRGRIYLEQGKKALAKQSFEDAIYYNKNIYIPQDYLNQAGI